jgi:hypothetical protein
MEEQENEILEIMQIASAMTADERAELLDYIREVKRLTTSDP